MMAHGIDLASPAIAEFCRKWKIRELKVFGSVLRGDFGPNSDIDFLVAHDDDAEWDVVDHLHMQRELSALLGRTADVSDQVAIERSDNRFIRDEVLSSAETVYAQR